MSENPRIAQLRVRLTRAELAELKLRAERAGMNTSQFIRSQSGFERVAGGNVAELWIELANTERINKELINKLSEVSDVHEIILNLRGKLKSLKLAENATASEINELTQKLDTKLINLIKLS